MESEFEIFEKRDPFFRCKCCNNLFYEEDINQYGFCFICANGDYTPPVKVNFPENNWWDF